MDVVHIRAGIHTNKSSLRIGDSVGESERIDGQIVDGGPTGDSEQTDMERVVVIYTEIEDAVSLAIKFPCKWR